MALTAVARLGRAIPRRRDRAVAPTRLRPGGIAAAVTAVCVVAAIGMVVGPVAIAPQAIALELLDHFPGIDAESGLSRAHKAIVWEIRAPRIVLSLLVGSLLAGSGAAYQGVFRNPLADPYLLGIAAGAGLGATIAIVNGYGGGGGLTDPIPVAAFMGALFAVGIAAVIGTSSKSMRSPATLLLAGVAVASFFTAVQTYVQQQNAETIREVYDWILGQLSVAGWDSVTLLLPYAVVTSTVLVLSAGAIDVLAVGDEEASTLGLRPGAVRAVVLVAASLAAAAAVAVSGLIGFVGLVVPHVVRLTSGVSNRLVIPLSLALGGAFLCLADMAARTLVSPSELPIGVVTAFVGAPFFLYILRSQANSVR